MTPVEKILRRAAEVVVRRGFTGGFHGDRPQDKVCLPCAVSEGAHATDRADYDKARQLLDDVCGGSFFYFARSAEDALGALYIAADLAADDWHPLERPAPPRRFDVSWAVPPGPDNHLYRPLDIGESIVVDAPSGRYLVTRVRDAFALPELPEPLPCGACGRSHRSPYWCPHCGAT